MPGGLDAVPGSRYATPPTVIHEMNLKHSLEDHRKLYTTRSSDNVACELSYEASGTIILHV